MMRHPAYISIGMILVLCMLVFGGSAIFVHGAHAQVTATSTAAGTSTLAIHLFLTPTSTPASISTVGTDDEDRDKPDKKPDLNEGDSPVSTSTPPREEPSSPPPAGGTIENQPPAEPPPSAPAETPVIIIPQAELPSVDPISGEVEPAPGAAPLELREGPYPGNFYAHDPLSPYATRMYLFNALIIGLIGVILANDGLRKTFAEIGSTMSFALTNRLFPGKIKKETYESQHH